MSAALATGSAGLVGSEAVAYFADLGMDVVGIDYGMRAKFFGPDASTKWVRDRPIRWRFLQAEKISMEELLRDSRITTDTRTLMALLSNKLARQFYAEPNSGWSSTETVFGD
jgi:hypothetical protein